MRVLLIALCLSSFLQIASAADLLIRNVTVVDVGTGSLQPKQFVLIHDGLIKNIGTAPIPATPATRVVEGTGKFLIPGLWDMNVHLWFRDHQLPQYLANGVVGVRDMGSDLNWLNQSRDLLKAGKLTGPHILTCGPAVDGQASLDPKFPVLVTRSPVDARLTFERLDDLEVDFVHVLPNLPRDAYFALVERARKYFKPVAGEIPYEVRLEEATNARQKSIDGPASILLACSRLEERLRGRMILASEKNDAAALSDLIEQARASFDPQKADALLKHLVRYDVAVSSYGLSRDLVDRLRKAGVTLLAGSGAGFPDTQPGAELHRQLELLVEAGLSPAAALRSATLEPARFLAAEESAGSVGVGRVADLVLLDADPLTDIRNTRKTHAVILGGRYLTPAQLLLPKTTVHLGPK